LTHINHETSKAIVAEARRIGASRIVMEDLCHIRDRIQAGKRVRTRLHGWAFRQLQTFVEYKAGAVGSRSSTSIPPAPARRAPIVEVSASASGIVSCAKSVVSGRTPTATPVETLPGLAVEPRCQGRL
jgi:IS605 OrfB family transposase